MFFLLSQFICSDEQAGGAQSWDVLRAKKTVSKPEPPEHKESLGAHTSSLLLSSRAFQKGEERFILPAASYIHIHTYIQAIYLRHAEVNGQFSKDFSAQKTRVPVVWA